MKSHGSYGNVCIIPEVQEPEEPVEDHVEQVHQKESGVRALDMGFRQGKLKVPFIYELVNLANPPLYKFITSEIRVEIQAH